MAKTATDLARHALGLDGSRKRSYRNRYIVSPGTSQHATWMAMVESGDAAIFRHAVPPNDLFQLTRAGAEAVLRPGESLDPEDFP